jgi:hypothetical protein
MVNSLPEREHHWVQVINPSYNIAPILDRFKGVNHPRYGKTVSQEVRNKISATLTGRKFTPEHIKNIVQGSRRKVVYCYDAVTYEYVTKFESIRAMAKELKCTNLILQRKIDTSKIQHCIYKGNSCSWLLCTKSSPYAPLNDL